MRASSRLLLCGLTVAAAPGWAQPTAAPSPAPPGTRPGRFHLGPVWVTPLFMIKSVGLDTNVFYTAEKQHADVSAEGGPGLRLVLPIRRASRYYVEGSLDYLFFLRTKSERRIMGGASTGLLLKGDKTAFELTESYSRIYDRPSFEVDDRLGQLKEQTRGELTRRLFWRIGVKLGASRARYDTPAGQDYLGTDPRQTLSRDEYGTWGGLTYALTVKTSFVAEAEQQWNRFPFQPRRDAVWQRLSAGFQTDHTALIAGQAVLGVRLYRPEASSEAGEVQTTYADVNVAWNATPRTHFLVRYRRDVGYSAFSPAGSPTLVTEEIGLGLEKRLVSRIDVRLFGRRTHLLSDGEVTVEVPDQGPVTAVRDDTAWEYGADLGYSFRSKLRIGVVAQYTDRRSTIAYFGIEGLVVGMSVRYNPN